jgi:hypothetical protein
MRLKIWLEMPADFQIKTQSNFQKIKFIDTVCMLWEMLTAFVPQVEIDGG